MDLRSSPRVPVMCPAIFSGDHMVGQGTIVNLSVPGCAIQTQDDIRPGDYLEMRVLMPDEAPPVAIALAKVRWARENMAGVEFILVKPDEQTRLRRFVEAQLLQAEDIVETVSCAAS